MSTRPIEDYALLSDCHTAALVSRAGSVDWLCMPRFDSPSVFGRLLGEEAGHWALHPAGEWEVHREYLDRSLVLRTVFRTPTGTVELIDALPVGPNERGHDLGAGAPHALIRRVRCTDGHVPMVFVLAPRPEYGLVHPLFRPAEAGCVARGGATLLRLSTSANLHIEDDVVRGRFDLREGDSQAFALQLGWTDGPPLPSWSAPAIAERLADTLEAWRSWSEHHQSYEGPWAELLRHSGRVLQGLTYYPTGAIVAAPTTSLPEVPGGSRNWDYRYAWVRDASFTLNALWVAACPDEAYKFFDFVADAALSDIRRGGDLQIMFGIGGERDLSERTLPHLPGWRGSAPVRIGNDAWHQRQIDVYGELLDAAFRLRDYVAHFEPATRRLLAALADAAAARWQQPDQGIWEVRGPPAHHLYSKLMCWVALDRAIRLAEVLEAEAKVADWARTRDAIRGAIWQRGWNDAAGAFMGALDGDALDASTLMLPIVGFIAGDHPRMRATLRAVEAHLTDAQGLVHRYRGADGLEGDEGPFILCTFWLAHAWALAGDTARARLVFDRAAGFANDVGLLAEEVDSGSGTLLGNHPQAFSHIGLINAAWAIAEAESGPG